jgi:hypothetical protein
MEWIENTMVGDVYGDVKEYGEAALGCFCCLMCSGPILLILSILVFVGSFTDDRILLIDEYNKGVDVWNVGVGEAGTFKGIPFEVSTSGDNKFLLGEAAPENFRDKSQRPEEKFSSVTMPWYYTLKQADATAMLGSSNTYQDLVTNQKTLKISDAGGEFHSVVFPQVQEQNIKYRWYVKQSSSSGSSSIECRKPNYNYPGTRFASVPYCDAWCKETMKGVWFGGEDIDSTCYKQSSVENTGCCKVYFALNSMCFRVKPSARRSLVGPGENTTAAPTDAPTSAVLTSSPTMAPTAAAGTSSTHFNVVQMGLTSSMSVSGQPLSVAASADEGGCAYGYRSEDTSLLPIESASSGGKLKSVGMVAISYSLLQISTSGSSRFFTATDTLTGYSADNFELSIRHEDDPYIQASLLTDGCSSCTNEKQPMYPRPTCADDASTHCFGLTPEQERQLALALLVMGSFMMLFPCGLYQCMKGSRGDKGGGDNQPQYAQPQQGNIQMPQFQQQYPQQGQSDAYAGQQPVAYGQQQQAMGYPQQGFAQQGMAVAIAQPQQGMPVAQAYPPQQQQGYAQGYPPQQGTY